MGFFPKDRTYRAFLHNKLFFLIAPKDLHYYWASAQPCAVNNTFFSLWEGQKWGFFPKDRTYRAFLHNKLFFLITPRDLHYYWASAQPCAALRSLAQPCAALRSLAKLTTPFLASGKAKNGVFSLRIAHIAPFYTINSFF